MIFFNQYQCKYLIKINISENEQFGSLAIFQFTINFHRCLFASLTVMLVAEQLDVKLDAYESL